LWTISGTAGNVYDEANLPIQRWDGREGGPPLPKRPWLRAEEADAHLVVADRGGSESEHELPRVVRGRVPHRLPGDARCRDLDRVRRRACHTGAVHSAAGGDALRADVACRRARPRTLRRESELNKIFSGW